MHAGLFKEVEQPVPNGDDSMAIICAPCKELSIEKFVCSDFCNSNALSI